MYSKYYHPGKIEKAKGEASQGGKRRHLDVDGGGEEMGVRLTRQDDERARERERERLYGLLPLSFRCSLTRKWFMEIKRGGGECEGGAE